MKEKMVTVLGCLAASLLFGFIGYGLCLKINSIYPYSVDGFTQIFHGGFCAGIGFFVISLMMSSKPLSEIPLSDALPIFGMVLIVPPLIPLFVLGPLAILSDLFGVQELWEQFFFETLGGFLSGSLSVGLLIGLLFAISEEKRIW